MNELQFDAMDQPSQRRMLRFSNGLNSLLSALFMRECETGQIAVKKVELHMDDTTKHFSLKPGLIRSEKADGEEVFFLGLEITTPRNPYAQDSTENECVLGIIASDVMKPEAGKLSGDIIFQMPSSNFETHSLLASKSAFYRGNETPFSHRLTELNIAGLVVQAALDGHLPELEPAA